MKVVRKVNKKIQTFFLRFFSMEMQAKMAGIKIGKDNLFYSNFWSSAEPYLITCGNNCHITKGVKMFTHGGCHVVRQKDPHFDVFGKVKIGDNVYIGNNALIMPGVTIGNNVLIASGAVVCHSVPDNVVVGGNPAHILCSIEEYYQRNLPYNTKTKGLEFDSKRKVLLGLSDEMFVKKRMMKQPIE